MLINIVVVVMILSVGIISSILQYKKGKSKASVAFSIIATIFLSIASNLITDGIKQVLSVSDASVSNVISNELETDSIKKNPSLGSDIDVNPGEEDSVETNSSDIIAGQIQDNNHEPNQSNDLSLAPTPTPKPSVTGITLNRNSIQLTVGESSNLTPSITPSNATDYPILWSSSDLSVVEVSNDGMIKAVGGGTAVITASCEGVSCECSVLVYVPVESLGQSSTGIDMEKGDTRTYSVYIYPSNATDQDVMWSSSDPSVVSAYGDGKTVILTGLNPGSAIITASCGGKSISQECKVFVTATSWDITNIPRMEDSVGDWYELWLSRGATFQIQTQFWPDGANNNVGCFFTSFGISDGYGGATYDSGITVDSSGLISVSNSSDGGAIKVQGANLGYKFIRIYISESDPAF